MRRFGSIAEQMWEDAPSSVQDRAAHPGASSQLQDAGLVQRRDDPGKDTRAFRKWSVSTSGHRASTDKYLGGKQRESLYKCTGTCRQHWHP